MSNNPIEHINQKYVNISNKITEYYERKFGLKCDLYFPKNSSNPNVFGNFDNINLFSTHGTVEYSDEPDVLSKKFYIPKLLKRESMNSPEDEFDSLYLDGEERPFIETSKSNELPIQTKVVVHIGSSTMNFVVERKQVVNGASGHQLLRQYLTPLTGENT